MDNAIYPSTPLAHAVQRPLRGTTALTAPPKAAALRPEGHNAFWEGARPWLVLLGATALTTIGAYIFAKDSIDTIAAGHGTITDGLITGSAVGLGVLLDAAIVISGMRAHQEKGWWAFLSWVMFTLCIGVEAMTVAYFFKVIQPESVPSNVAHIIDGIHNLLYFFRAGLPPLIVAFFAVAVRNLVFTQADRKRQMKEGTGARLMVLEAKLADPANDEDKATLVREYETQLRLFEYASDADQHEKDANTALIGQFKDIWGIGKTNAKTETALHEDIARMRAQFAAEAQALREQLEEQFGAQIQQLQEQIAALVQGQEDEQASFSNQVGTPRQPGAKTPPKPGTRKFGDEVYRLAQQLVQSDESVTFFTVAAKVRQEFGVEYSIEDVKAALTTRRNEQIRRLRPGQELAPDPVLDALF